MKAEEVRRIRERMGMDRTEFAELLCLSGYGAYQNIETGFRRPSKLAIRFLRYLDALPTQKAKAFIEEFRKHKLK